MKRPSRLNKSAFTLLELMVTLAIIAVLVVISMGVYSKFVKRAQKAACIERMRNIHTALSTYVLVYNTWPQLPATLENGDEEQHWEWWIKNMEQHGVAEREWLCPTDDAQRKADYAREGKPRDKYEGTYVPTHFEEGQDIPWKWNQPWLIERGDFHGDGMHAIFPDKAVKTYFGPSGQPKAK